ncbi:MAG: GatB/YqeY domain-containing protein [Candidatus Doudnabacteria bacterium]|nr:GatB/YqeY domain-containing protein [Candidatus Doudnabacteria bacterium]
MLIEKLEADYKAAFKAHDEIAKSSLSNVRAAIKNAELEKREPLTDQEVAAVLAKKVKQHKDSISEFEKGNRPDLVEKERAQMQILENYLPKQMPEDQVRKLVSEVISDLAAKPADFGRVMKEVINRAAGQTEGAVVSKIVKEELK